MNFLCISKFVIMNNSGAVNLKKKKNISTLFASKKKIIIKIFLCNRFFLSLLSLQMAQRSLDASLCLCYYQCYYEQYIKIYRYVFKFVFSEQLSWFTFYKICKCSKFIYDICTFFFILIQSHLIFHYLLKTIK